MVHIVLEKMQSIFSLSCGNFQSATTPSDFTPMCYIFITLFVSLIEMNTACVKDHVILPGSYV